MKKKYSYTFIRFGGLSPMKQIRFGMDTYHAPPKKKGIYLFPHKLIEKFLLGATDCPTNISNKSYWLKDEDGNKIQMKDFYLQDDIDDRNINPKYKKIIRTKKIKKDSIWGSEHKDGNHYVSIMKKPRKVSYSGELWCHLGEHLRPEHIIEQVGSWVKVSMQDYILAMKLDFKCLVISMNRDGFVARDFFNPFRYYSKDHYEVFIEKIN